MLYCALLCFDLNPCLYFGVMNIQNLRLPSLKKISIRNYSLYPGALDFSYEFINGINLIIGGNGVGKTTFLNIIKYAMVGLYKKYLDVSRRDFGGVEHRRESRISLSNKYFSNRMDKSVDYNESAEVTLVFSIGTRTFTVTRSLYEPALKSVKVRTDGKEEALSGIVVSQTQYDKLFSQRNRNDKELEQTLQWKYEFMVAEAASLSDFDSLIFFVNDILFFDESRKTVMWDQDIQKKLASKYFMDPKLDHEREEAEREGKYQDSLARHKGEDIRAIRKVFDQIPEHDIKNRAFKDLVIEKEKKKKEIASGLSDLEAIQKERLTADAELNRTHVEKNNAGKELEELEVKKRREEEKIFTDLFKKVTPKYYDYKKYLKSSGHCPLCNNTLEREEFQKIANDDAHCMMCGNDIRSTEMTSPVLAQIKKDINDAHIKIRNCEKKIITLEDNMKKLDRDFSETTILMNELQTSLRALEFAIQKDQASDTSKTDSEFKAMNARIEVLEKEKREAERKSSDAFKLANEYVKQIQQHLLDSREQLSTVFNKFGSNFLGVKCELVYEDPNKGEKKRYFPRIGGVERYEEEELSESQRFFIDQSFRMSILNFLNTTSSFFMCETPDSSLDVSYEQNAAKVFLEYLKKPNELIMTSNLNNSEFLEHLIQQANRRVRHINLLKIGKQSGVQFGSKELMKTSNRIEKMINEHGK